MDVVCVCVSSLARSSYAWGGGDAQATPCLPCSRLQCGSALGIRHVSSSCAVMRVPVQAGPLQQARRSNQPAYLLGAAQARWPLRAAAQSPDQRQSSSRVTPLCLAPRPLTVLAY